MFQGIIKKMLEWKLKPKFEGMVQSMDGKKAYLLGTLTILVAVVGYFIGPVGVGEIQIPHYDWNSAWNMIWQGLLIIVGKSAVSKLEIKK